MRRVVWLIALCVSVVGTTLASIPPAAASPVFNALGVLPDGPIYSRAHGISGDGTTVVGESGSPNGYDRTSSLPFRWTESTGIQFVGIPYARGSAQGVSHDGAVVVGDAGLRAFRWQGGTASLLPSPPGEMDMASAVDVSDDGSVVVGGAYMDNFRSHGARWDGGVTFTPDAGYCGITCVGGEEIICGHGKSPEGYGPAIFRDGTMELLGYLGPSAPNGWYFGIARDVSRNGRAVVGYSSSPRATDNGYEAFRWTSREGMTGLGDLPGGYYNSWAWATSANGGVVVGKSDTRTSPTWRGLTDAFYWTPTAGMQKLSTVLTQGFGIDLSGWSRLDDAKGVSDSGLVIAGWGTRTNGVEEAFRVKLQQQIYVNWDEPISTSFKVMKQPRSLTEYVVYVPGSWPGMDWTPPLPNGMTPDEYKDQVMSELREIFVASGDMHEIDLLDSRFDAKRSAALEVRFGPPVTGPSGNSLLDGTAWDVAPKGIPGVDRFNARWDGQVAVFLQPGANIPTPAYTADTVAHEVGHGLGLRHIRPGALAPGEVMDYDFSEGMRESFSDLVQQIVEPPTATGDPQTDTHNPYYHLKRYVLGQDAGSSKPGTWDVGSITVMVFDITNINHAGKLHNVTPGMGVGSADGELGCETWSNVAYFPEVDPAVDTLSFYSFADSPLSIFASSEPGDVWDIVFGTGDAENPVLTFENLASGPLDGLLFQYDAGTDAYHVVGSFSGTVAEELTLWGQDPEPIPEPGTTVLLALAGLAGVMWRLPRLARRRSAARR